MGDAVRRCVLATVAIVTLGCHGPRAPASDATRTFADDDALLVELARVLGPEEVRLHGAPFGGAYRLLDDGRWIQRSRDSASAILPVPWLGADQATTPLADGDLRRTVLGGGGRWLALIDRPDRPDAERYRLRVVRRDPETGATTPLFEEPIDPARFAGVSPEGDAVLLQARAGWSRIAVDLERGAVTRTPLRLPDGVEDVAYTARNATLLADEGGRLHRATLTASGTAYEVALGPALPVVARHAGDLRTIVTSRDGTTAVVHDPSAASIITAPLVVARFGDAAPLATVPGTGFDVVAALSADGRWLASADEGDRIALRRLDDPGAPPPPRRVIGPAHGLKDLIIPPGRDEVIAVFWGGELRRWPLTAPPALTAAVGGERVTWIDGGPIPGADAWPALELSAHLERAAPDRLIVAVHNRGRGPAHELVARIDDEPATAPRRLVIGTVGAGATVVRSLALPPTTNARRWTIRVDAATGFAPPPVRLLDLPRHLPTRDAYLARARQIVDAGLAELRARTGHPDLGARLVLTPMPGNMVGFVTRDAGGAAEIQFQDVWIMDGDGLRTNRVVMQVDSHDELMRHAELFLYWYLPHELVHAAAIELGGPRLDEWESERLANTLQPELTRRVLERLGDAPYSAATMTWAYDRYVEALRGFVDADRRAAIDASYDGARPFAKGPFLVFLEDTAAYVYYAARLDQLADQRGVTDLERLARPSAAPR